MDLERAQAVRLSLTERLAIAAREQELDPDGQTAWLISQFENYLERWLAFCAVLEIPMESLLQDDLFAMVLIGSEEVSVAVGRLDEDHCVRPVWSTFLDALNDVRCGSDRRDAIHLRMVFAEVKSATE